ncbi:MAG TPA: cytochrome c-type biogenesis protein [Myxococcales bacterium]|nr:cytochrome c-type biogenesis protein [Myxococcales bacterium]
MRAAALLAALALPGLAMAQGTVSRPPPGSTLGAPRGQPLSGAALDARTEDVAGLLRCPVCQGLSVADSPATMARDMKAKVREELAAGYDKDQILEDFERSYGEFVRLQPTLHGVNWLVWLGPIAALLLGAVLIRRMLRTPAAGKAAAPAQAASAPSRDALPDDPRLAAAVLRVRELAYGWPGGIRPTKQVAS